LKKEGKKKVSMSDPITVNTTPHSSPPTDFSALRKTYRSWFGRILAFLVNNRAKSTLGQIVSKPQLNAAPADVSPSHDEKVYNHYVAYCKMIGGLCPITHQPLVPHTIERWDSLRHTQVATASVKKWELPKHPTAKALNPKLRLDRFQRHSRCAHCGTGFVDGKGRQTLSAFEFCGETELTSGSCKQLWLSKHPSECEVPSVETPLTLTAHVARVALCVSLQDVNETDSAPFEYRNFVDVKNIVNRKYKQETISQQSLWCETCVAYREQMHECSPVPTVGFDAIYRTTAEALQAAHRVEIAAIRKREQARLHRLAEFRQTTVAAHNVVWDRSFGKLFYHMVKRATSVADRVVVRDLAELERIPDLKPYCGDHLSAVSPQSCKHCPERSFTFSTGETIALCTDCGKATGHDMLLVENIFKATPGFIALWDARLNALGLSEWRAAFNEKFLWGDLSDLVEREDSASEESFTTPSERVNTAGWVGTDHEGSRADSSSRDRRAKRIRAAKRYVPLTKTVCLWCGEDIYARKGTHHCPDTDHRKRFNEEAEDLILDLLSIKGTLI
jgi:hypothetical protein